MMKISKKVLLLQIEKKRKEMIFLGMQTGFTSTSTINASKQLDNLLNQLGETKIKEVVNNVI